MAYYLYLISHHNKVLPVFILKLLVESLVLSHLNYALLVWGPALGHLLARLVKMHNRAIRIIDGLKKFNRVSNFRRQLNWLSVDSLIQYHCDAMMYRYYNSEHNNYPLIQFSRQSIYSTRTCLYFAGIVVFIVLNYPFHKSFIGGTLLHLNF